MEFVNRIDQNDAAEILPALRGDLSALKRHQLALDRLFDGKGEVHIVGDEDGLRRRVMLGLRQQVGGDPVRIVVLVGDDQHFRRPGDHVDADLPEHKPLGGGDIGVAGTHDFGDRRDCLCAISERRNRLRAADPVDFSDPGNVGGDQHQRIEIPVRRRNHHHDALNARDFRWNGVHQNRAGIGGRAARHIEADGINRRPARAKLNADGIRVSLIFRHLPQMMAHDALMREFQRLNRHFRRRAIGGLDLLGVTRSVSGVSSSRSNCFV